jgi:predicted Zn-dependent peptidase
MATTLIDKPVIQQSHISTTSDTLLTGLNKETISFNVESLKCLLIPINGASVVSIGVFINVGSRYEHEKNNGIAHFLEHMMFKGTKIRKSQQLILDMDHLGADYNAATSYDFTYYEMHGHPKHLETFIDIMIDLYANAQLDKEDIESERGVIIQEMQMTQDNIQRKIFETLNKIMYPTTSKAMRIIGTRPNLETMDRAMFKEFKEQFYTPDRTTLVVCGKIDSDETKQIIQGIYNKYRKAPVWTKTFNHSAVPKNYPIVLAKPSVNVKKIANVSQAHIIFAFPSFDINDSRNYALDLISDIFASGSTSRLFKLLRTRLGVSYTNRANNETNNDHGCFTLYTAVDSDRVIEVFDGLCDELRTLKTVLVDKDELDKVKNIKETAFLMSMQKPDEYMFYHGQQEMFMTHKPLLSEEIEKYRTVTAKHIIEIANVVLDERKMYVLVLGNVPDPVVSSIEKYSFQF